MRRIPIVLCAAIMVLAACGTAQAAPRGSYVAALAAPLAEPRQVIVDGVLWKCAGERCTAPSEGARPLLVCQHLVKTFGPVSRFTTPSGELSREELSRCNDQG
jgi:hypothetical protein